ncbi:hypothetical protein A7K93_09645 [Candidatus Methylacidiphilum fumarolicum]|nr:hypothetical protein A7K73_10880 [Candidatus Methylacidiphilum fumarolicum]TFE71835.1 hypothetical protein A7K72_10130 [Candidatus Methylacidiphilum fumarolicum]TFE72025.1 hypothetical protein A7K93_09645 [Candidatus Methylacidiphilum fumarolicum]TFE76469.1 hypothetical protein A7D33_09965 [Candidatus Methylacidiphilum fumarolicum]
MKPGKMMWQAIQAESLELNKRKCQMLEDLCLCYSYEKEQFVVYYSELDRFSESLGQTQRAESTAKS